MKKLKPNTKFQENFVEDTTAIINRHLGYVTKAHQTQRSLYIGFVHCIDNIHFPLLSEEELITFRKEYEELVNRLFTKQ